jgi:hypothetical protein
MITIMCTNVIHHIVHRMACLVLMCYALGPTRWQSCTVHAWYCSALTVPIDLSYFVRIVSYSVERIWKVTI